MNIQETKAYLDGVNAKRNEVKVGDNPYPENSNLHWMWISGWLDVAMNNLERKGVRI